MKTIVKTYLINSEINQLKLHNEIQSSGHVTGYESVLMTPNELKVIGESISNESALDLIIQNHEPYTLEEYKKIKNKNIDERTSELILSGITFNSVVFSSSETAQRNWMALDQFKAYHTYPVAVTTEDDGEYQFADATEVTNFVLTAMGTINSHYASGRALKLQVNAASDKAGVDAVQDNR